MRELRAAFVEVVAQEDATRLRFLDETSVRIDFARRYGRAPDGARLLYLPPYSPGFSLIELAFSKLKTALKNCSRQNLTSLTASTHRSHQLDIRPRGQKLV